MKQIHTVLIENDDGETVGKVIEGVPEIGHLVNVQLQDENGNPIQVSGVIVDVLDVRNPWN